MTNISFNFHETFSPQLLYLSHLLELASDNFCGDKYKISEITGIPTGQSSGKVIPHIKYLAYMGLINFKVSKNVIELTTTDLGKLIFHEDRYLLQDLTKLILHYNISSMVNGAPQWCFLFRDYPYEFSQEIDFSKIEERGQLQFGKNIEIGPIKTLYGKNGEFASISNVEINSKKITFNSVIPSFEYLNCYAYMLLKDWEALCDNNEITIDDVIEKIKWNKGFGFDYNTTLEVLEDISANGYININKQLSPITIIKKCSSKDMLCKLYDDII